MTNTEGERLMRIETLIEHMMQTMERVEGKVDTIDADLRKDVADLAALKNKGAGILIGVALAAGAAGAGLLKLGQALLN